jgi:hypothetical protein
MPQGWQLQPESSGPDEGGSYKVTYKNQDDPLPAKAFRVGFLITLYSSEEQARSFFSSVTSKGRLDMPSDLNMEATYISVPNVDESAAFKGSSQSAPIPTDYSMIVFREKNAIAWVIVQSLVENLRGLQEALYYVSLITEKLSE